MWDIVWVSPQGHLGQCPFDAKSFYKARSDLDWYGTTLKVVNILRRR